MEARKCERRVGIGEVRVRARWWLRDKLTSMDELKREKES